jgi:hypothetical protein
MLQYFSITVIPLPTSNNASWLASLPQLLHNFLLPLRLVDVLIDINIFSIYHSHLVKIPMNAIANAAAIKDNVATTTNFALLFINYFDYHTYKNIPICISFINLFVII